MTTVRYLSTRVPVAGDPCHVVTGLARAARSDPHVVYEKPPVWTFAAGRLAEIVITATGAVLRGPAGTVTAGRDRRRRLAEIPRLLAQVGVADWRAYGVATFDLSTDDPADGDPVLVHLVVPEVEVRIAGGEAVVRATTRRALDRFAELVRRPAEAPSYRATPVEVTVPSNAGYRRAVQAAVRRIRSGGLQKVVLSRAVPLDIDVDLYGTYALGRSRNAPARSFLVSLNGQRAAGFSPETVLEVGADRRVLTQPLAGTRALLADDAVRSHQLRADLLGNAKEVYEHAISVRAACDDLAAVCRPESVAVTDFMTVKPRGTVQHLGSAVAGELAGGLGPWDAFAAVFPAVTVAGIPRPAAYECIREYEETPRGLYGGAVLAVGADGSLDAALVLRTVFQRDGRSWLRAGAGIVSESDPDREFEETCEKLRSVALHLVANPAPDQNGGSHAMRSADGDGPSPLDRRTLREDIAALLDRAPDDIDEAQSLIEQGLDSVAVMTLASKWHHHGITVDLVELAERPTVNAWWDLLARRAGQPTG